VEDEGSGIERGKEGMRMIGERYGSSKDRNGGRVGPIGMGGYGFRGEGECQVSGVRRGLAAGAAGSRVRLLLLLTADGSACFHCGFGSNRDLEQD
jgi:hypothetical protein